MFRFIEKIDLSNFTLLIPSVSVGNVGQLTNDLLISTYNLKLIATIYHKAIIPAVGPNPYDPNSDICVSCELYASTDKKIAVLQLRTSIEQKFADTFFDDFKSFILEKKFKNVIILTSTYSHEMHNINTSQYRYVSNRESSVFDQLQILPLDASPNGSYLIYGGGYALKLYNKLISDDTSTIILIKYTSEGDNRPDAYSTLSVVAQILELPRKRLSEIMQPYSWNLVYGGPPPIGIF